MLAARKSPFQPPQLSSSENFSDTKCAVEHKIKFMGLSENLSISSSLIEFWQITDETPFM